MDGRDRMAVLRQMIPLQLDGLDATGLGDDIVRKARPLPGADRNATAQVRYAECALPVAAVGRADEGKQVSVGRGGQERPVAQYPALGRKIAGEHDDLADERRWHVIPQTGAVTTLTRA